MDELKNNTQEAQEDSEAREEYPFIVEITAALLTDTTSIEDAEKNLADPSFIADMPEIVGHVITMIRKEIEENPRLRRETAPFYDVYQKIPGYDPALDPESEAFNADAYMAAIEAFPFDEFFKQVLLAWAEMVDEQKEIRELMPDVAALAYEVQKVIHNALAVTRSDDFIKALQHQIDRAREQHNLPKITARPVHSLDYPLDKPNSKIWNLLTTADPNGQLKLDIDVSKKGSKQNAVVVYAINFDELPENVTISKTLTQYDKRVCIAYTALLNGGNDVFSVSQIYRQMGNTGSPSAAESKKINDSLTKMGIARIYIDNEKEAATQKKRTHFRYDGSFLPFERVEAYINNSFCEAAIHPLREPPIISFSRERKQITTIPRKVLESPISKTEANLRIEDYLLERISHMKLKKAEPKLLYATIFENCDIKEKKQRQRAKDKILTYLKHYKKTGFIRDYEIKEDAIEFLI